jgi:hypothetical protein
MREWSKCHKYSITKLAPQARIEKKTKKKKEKTISRVWPEAVRESPIIICSKEKGNEKEREREKSNTTSPISPEAVRESPLSLRRKEKRNEK